MTLHINQLTVLDSAFFWLYIKVGTKGSTGGNTLKFPIDEGFLFQKIKH
jgi:hypothetical protein